MRPRTDQQQRASNPITVIRSGQGPELLLVHGGASPEATWSGLAPLASRFTQAFAYRRGFVPNPPAPHGRQDFDIDADDLEPLLDTRPHLLAHSYGACGAVIAAARRPELVRSLTLLEPAFDLLRGDAEMARLRRLSDVVLTHGLEADPAMLREFLRIAGAPVDDGPLPPGVANAVRRAQGTRSPYDYDPRPDLESLRVARIPALVASGAHSNAIDRQCEAVAATLDAEWLVASGAGHFVAAAPGFADRLEQFLLAG